MKIKYFIALFIFLATMACVSAETFTPDQGIFAFREVETFEINEINFTVPADYNVTYHGDTQMNFTNGHDDLSITVDENAKVKKIKSDRSKNITSGKTMLGSAEGYLIDDNGTYTFSYKADEKLVVIKSGDMSVMIGAMDNN